MAIELGVAEAGMTLATEPTPINRSWTGPYGGVPPFDKVRVEDLGPALEVAIAAELDAVASIAADPAAPTFANTIDPLEKATRDFERVQTIYAIWGGNLSINLS
jgi:peptidyl-dipeptidase Dcp